jgi:hypothetical protein
MHAKEIIVEKTLSLKGAIVGFIIGVIYVVLAAIVTLSLNASSKLQIFFIPYSYVSKLYCASFNYSGCLVNSFYSNPIPMLIIIFVFVILGSVIGSLFFKRNSIHH